MCHIAMTLLFGMLPKHCSSAVGVGQTMAGSCACGLPHIVIAMCDGELRLAGSKKGSAQVRDALTAHETRELPASIHKSLRHKTVGMEVVEYRRSCTEHIDTSLC